MLNGGYLQYTYMHRKAFVFVVNKIVKDEAQKKELLRRAEFHDMDKMLLYTLIEKEASSAYHRKTAAHHMGNSDYKDVFDIMEAVIDYECAGYTKEDKPRNAYDTIMELKPNHSDELLKITSEWGIDKHYLNTPQDEEWQEYSKTIVLPMTEEVIMREIYGYIFKYPVEAKRVYDYANHWIAENLGL